MDLTGDGRQSILTARAKFPLGKKNSSTNNPAAFNQQHHSNTQADSTTPTSSSSKGAYGQLVCLEMPQPYSFDEATGTPLEKDGLVFDPLSPRHLPWKEQ